MKIKEFLCDKLIYIITFIVWSLLLGGFLWLIEIRIEFIWLFEIMSGLIFIACIVWDFVRKWKYYQQMWKIFDGLENKTLLAEVMEVPHFIDGKILYQVVQYTNKYMNDCLAESDRVNREYREYIEMWVHEIKTPIATCKLLIENNDNEVTESIGEEVTKVEDYIEQVLFYARSNAVEKDYLIKEINLKKSINAVIRKNANTLIEKRVKVDIRNVDKIVSCDSKWIEFILGQIVSNSIKYMDKKESVLKIYSENMGNDVLLKICDNGIGMDEKSVIKAFEKGYTGKNGRKFVKSTGMGLYLCKKLCEKLGLGINIKSKENEGTEVTILLPINDMMKF